MTLRPASASEIYPAVRRAFDLARSGALRLDGPRRFIGPIDYSCMGYSVPAALGAAPLVCVLRDQELGQIAQFQRTSLNRDTCSVLAPYRVSAFAAAVNAEFVRVEADNDVEDAIERGLQVTRGGRPAVVEVAIDYAQKTSFTRGVVSTTLRRLPLGDRLRMLSRAAIRHVAGSHGTKREAP